MAQTNINIRMDEDLKKSFDYVCDQLGLNITTAITIFAKKMVRENAIPFEVSFSPNADTMAAIDAAEQGKDMYGPFDSVSSLMEALNADD